MERVVGWVDDGDQGRRSGQDPARPRHGLRLRPTGMVVFATLEGAEPVREWRPASSRERLLSQSLPPMRPGTTAASSPVVPHQVLQHASRAMRWLLGR